MREIDKESVAWHGRRFDYEGVRYTNHTMGGFSLKFHGQKLEVDIVTNGPVAMPADQQGFLVSVVNGEETMIPMAETTMHLTLVDSEKPVDATVSLLKRTEQQYASFGTKAIWADEEATVAPTEEKKRKLLFIGDSYTCGYCNMGQPEDPFDVKDEYGDKAYGNLTGQAFDAEVQYVCRSGVGLYASYGEDVNQRVTTILIGTLLTYVDYVGCEALGIPQIPNQPVDFVPDAVVINLGTNDTCYTKGGDDRRQAYGEAWSELLKNLRNDYPNAELVAALGPVSPESQLLFPYLCEAVEKRRVAGDTKVSTLLIPQAPAEEGMGSCGHPGVVTDRSMSREVVRHLSIRLGWKA